MKVTDVGDVLIAIQAKRIGSPARTPGVCTCKPPCIPGIPIHPNTQSKETTMVVLSEIENQAARVLGVSTEKMVAAKTWDGRLDVMGKSPFPDHKPDNFHDNRGGGKEPVDPKNIDVGLGTCCENGTMAHLQSHRDAINSEINRRNGAHAVRFAK
jgi:hypothetical protein